MARITSEHPELANVLSPTLAPLAWIELPELVTALACARDVLPNSTVPRKVGRGTMSATFARLFGADPSSVSPETVLAALPTYWDRYHDWGAIEVAIHSTSADVTLVGFSGSVDVCALVAAQLERIVELTGADVASTTHPRCRCKGAETCDFKLIWSR